MTKALTNLAAAYWLLFMELIRPKPVRDLLDTAWETGSEAMDAFSRGLLDRKLKKENIASNYIGTD